MGWETANIHLGSQKAVVPIRRDLANRPARWLRQANKLMVKATNRDWKDWRNA